MFRHSLGKALFIFGIVGTIAYSWIQLEGVMTEAKSQAGAETAQPSSDT